MPEQKTGGRRRKAPPNTYWRNGILWGRAKVRGALRRWSLRTDDVEVARARVAEDIAKLKGRAFYGEDRKRYVDVVVSWGQQIVHDVGPGTAKRYAVSLRQLEPWLMPLHLDEINRKKVMEMVDGRRGQGVSTATIRRDMVALGSVLEHAIDQEWRDEDDNPALSRLKKLKERRDPIVLPEHADIARVIAKARSTNPMFAAMIDGALKTGCRQNELVLARRTKLDHPRRQLTVVGKRNKLRTIDLGDAYEGLRMVPARIGCEWLFWHHDGSTFRGVSGAFHVLVRAVDAEAQKEAQAAALARGEPLERAKLVKASFRRFPFHHLRHRFAVDWLKAGRSIYDLKEHLGHTSVKTTEIYLAYLTPDEARAVKFPVRTESQKESQPERSTA